MTKAPMFMLICHSFKRLHLKHLLLRSGKQYNETYEVCDLCQETTIINEIFQTTYFLNRQGLSFSLST